MKFRYIESLKKSNVHEINKDINGLLLKKVSRTTTFKGKLIYKKMINTSPYILAFIRI